MKDLLPKLFDREALVYVAVNISDTGTVTEAQLEQGGFHDRRFEEAALKIARRIRFVPASFNGTPVEFRAIVPIRFQIPDASGRQIKGVTPEFRREAKKVQELIEKKDVAGAHFHAQWMLSEKVKLAFEYAVLQSTLAYTHYRAGNLHRALKASREVTAHTGTNMDRYHPGGPLPRISPRDFLLTKDLLDQMLMLRFVLDSSLGFYLDAVYAQADRQALGMAVSDDSYAQDAARLLDELNHSTQLRGHARIDESKDWDHELWFNHFSVHAVQGGSLAAMALSCDGLSRTLAYAEGAEWTIPSKWGHCRLKFAGTPGTEFDILEFRDAATDTARSTP